MEERTQNELLENWVLKKIFGSKREGVMETEERSIIRSSVICSSCQNQGEGEKFGNVICRGAKINCFRIFMGKIALGSLRFGW
jgi:hypothetical protein